MTAKAWVILGTMLFFVFCTGEQKSVDTVIAVIDGDTLSRSRALKLVPDTLADSVLARRLGATILLSHARGKDSLVNADCKDLAERLSLTTNKEWSEAAARLVFSAGRHIYHVIDSCKESSMIRNRINSVFDSVEYKGQYPLKIDMEKAVGSSEFSDTSYINYRKTLADVFGGILLLSSREAELVAEFVLADRAITSDAAKKNVAAMKGLIAGDGRGKAQKPLKTEKLVSRSRQNMLDKSPENDEVKQSKQQAQKDSRLALKYRDQQSIQDSIAGHIPQIQLLYKKHLKVHSDMSGIVFVRFEIAPNGTVKKAGVKNTQINEDDFIEPFLAYVKEIRFKPVPAKIGSMVIDFPFEFSPEN